MSESKAVADIRRERLRQWMEKYQISQAELSRRLSVQRAYVSSILNKRHFGEKSARNIEQCLGMQKGHLDVGKSDQVDAVAHWEKSARLPDGSHALVPQVLIGLVDGVVVKTKLDLPALAFTRDWLLDHGIAAVTGLCVMDVTDDAMQNYLRLGDRVLIDTTQNKIRDREVYVVQFADELRIKRLEKTFDGGVRILSDNPNYKTEELSAEPAKSLVVVGRVVWRAG